MIRIGKKTFDADGNGLIEIEKVETICRVRISPFHEKYYGHVFKNKVIYEKYFQFEEYHESLTDLLAEAIEIAQKE
jgi:hypothetical protein